MTPRRQCLSCLVTYETELREAICWTCPKGGFSNIQTLQLHSLSLHVGKIQQLLLYDYLSVIIILLLFLC